MSARILFTISSLESSNDFCSVFLLVTLTISYPNGVSNTFETWPFSNLNASFVNCAFLESFVKYPKYPPFLPELLSSEFSFAIFSKSPPFFISLSKDSALDFNSSFLESSTVLFLSSKVDTNIW